MSSESETEPTPDALDLSFSKMSYPTLLEEAGRQMGVCNACRYCEGYCAVFPALERRQHFDVADLVQLGNLCHDCRACFDACMYAPPHEFAINPPKVLAAVRLGSYDRYIWPHRVPQMLRGWRGIVTISLVSVAIVFALALSHTGLSGLVNLSQRGARSPYAVVPRVPLLILLLVPTIYSIVVIIRAGWLYWGETGGGRVYGGALLRAAKYALTLRYLRGGGAQCNYPSDEVASSVRRRLHHLVFYGFLLCAVSTVSAAVLEDLLNSMPPYSALSVPVVSGTIGGMALVVGSLGLLILKTRSSAVTGLSAMTVKDYGLLVALVYLVGTGLLVLLLRDTTAFSLVFIAHLAAIVLCFALAPYTKFVHFVFRLLAIVRDNLEGGEHPAR